MDYNVKFRAVHTKKSWRGTGHSSFDKAINDPKRGARALFNGMNESVREQGYGDPLYVFIWDEQRGYAIRPNPNADIQIVEVPVWMLQEFDKAKQINEGKLLPYFVDSNTGAAAHAHSHVRGNLSKVAMESVAWWWVNHKQTFRTEIDGGYIWSPKRNSNGAHNQTYTNLTHINAGDIVVSYAAGLIKALGVATGGHFEAAKPQEFGRAGSGWSDLGWMVPVDWVELVAPIRPKQHLSEIQPLLPEKNSPLQANGNGNQGCYLASIPSQLGDLLTKLASRDNSFQVAVLQRSSIEAADDEIEKEIALDRNTPDTDKIQLIRARRGQGLFRQRVMSIDARCRVTGVANKSLLIASHIQPWRNCTNEQRLDGDNGLMLSPHVDRLFDQGWITFSDDGELITSKSAEPILSSWGLNLPILTAALNRNQRKYMAYHRKWVFHGPY